MSNEKIADSKDEVINEGEDSKENLPKVSKIVFDEETGTVTLTISKEQRKSEK